MTSLRFATLVSLALALPVVVPAGAAEDVTMGHFIQKLAAARSLDAATPRQAGDSLSASGVHLPAGLDFSRELTERDLVQISRPLGLKLTTSRPDAKLDARRVELFLRLLKPELATTNTGIAGARGEEGDQGDDDDDGEGPPFDPFTKGKGVGKAPVTETEL
jgi:hypothetical protein